MYRLGHYGVSLIVFTPLGLALVLAGEPELAAVTGAVMLWLAMLPDVDHRIPGLRHRGPTHTLVFALVVGTVLAALGVVVPHELDPVVQLGLGVFGFVVGFVSVLAHLAADLLTPMGVQLLWPFSRRRYSLELVRADSPLANYALLLGGVLLAGGVIGAALTL